MSDEDRRKRRADWKQKNEVRLRDYFALYYQERRTQKLAYAAQQRLQNVELKRETKRLVESRRRALAKEATGSFSQSDIDDICSLQRGRCAECKKLLKGKFQIDHILPLARGGTNDRQNIQLLCKPCNSSKWAFDPFELARKKNRLL